MVVIEVQDVQHSAQVSQQASWDYHTAPGNILKINSDYYDNIQNISLTYRWPFPLDIPGYIMPKGQN
jgi:hypothetical protein